MQTRFDAIVLGAGVAGSTAAIRLAQAGWSVALLEKQRFPRRKVCGECLAASNLPLLDALGVGAEFHALAGPELRRVALMHGEETIHADLPACTGQAHPWGKALGREHLDALLLHRAAALGATVLQPWLARAVAGQAGAYRCLASPLGSTDAIHLEAPVLIAAHGAWEPGLAQTPPHQRVSKRSDLFAFKATFAQGSLAAGVLPVLAFDGGYGGMVVGERGLLTLACCIRRDRLQACRKQARAGNAGDAVLAYLTAQCRGVRDALDGAATQGRWLSVGPLRPGVRLPRDGGRYFLIGNAAGEAHPIIGEGMSMAMQAAWLVSEYLLAEPRVMRDARLQQRILRAYAQAWRSCFVPRMRMAALFAHAAMRPVASPCFLPALRSWPAIMTHAARWSGKVNRPLALARPLAGAPLQAAEGRAIL